MPAGTSCPNKDDDIEIRVMTTEDHQRVLDFMAMYFFCDEPLNIGSEPKDELVKPGNMVSYIEQGTSLMAVVKETDELVGLTITGSKKPHHYRNRYQEAVKQGESKPVKILRFLARAERESDLFQRYNVERIMFVTATCVKSGMRGKNVGARLYTAVAVKAKQMGFELLASDCTSFFSARIKERLSWDCVNTIAYKDYVDEAGKVVFSPPPPHVCCKSYAIRL